MIHCKSQHHQITKCVKGRHGQCTTPLDFFLFLYQHSIPFNPLYVFPQFSHCFSWTHSLSSLALPHHAPRFALVWGGNCDLIIIAFLNSTFALATLPHIPWHRGRGLTWRWPWGCAGWPEEPPGHPYGPQESRVLVVAAAGTVTALQRWR